ncbi:putative secreted salivary gland peptide [Ixodes scapularis]
MSDGGRQTTGKQHYGQLPTSMSDGGNQSVVSTMGVDICLVPFKNLWKLALNSCAVKIRKLDHTDKDCGFCFVSLRTIQLRLLAQDWADHLAAQPKGSPLEHRPDNKYGENIYTASSSSPSFMVNAQTPVDFWYNEIKDYDYANPGFSYKTGHFTQVVWKSTTNVGCAISKAASRSAYFVVCNYNPPGNYLGQFKQNVLPVASG